MGFQHELLSSNLQCVNFMRFYCLILLVSEFTRLENMDCLFRKNLHYFQSKQPKYEDCNTWCRDNSECAGYVEYQGICYFKTQDCESDLFASGGRTTFLIKGKVKEINTWCSILQRNM